MISERKITSLISKCGKYKNNLMASLERELLKTLPENVINDYQSNDGFDFEKLFEIANAGRSIYWTSITNMNLYQFQGHSSLSHPKLHKLIRKINLVTKILDCLNTDCEPAEKILELTTLLSEDNQLLLKSDNKKKFFSSDEGKEILKSLNKCKNALAMPLPS
jgi:predicted transcriptional regulator